MRPRALIAGAALLLGTSILITANAFAATPVSSPDDICAPTDDPCVIDQAYQVLPPGNLDFGLRTVHVTGPAALLEDSVDILCGALLVDSGGINIVVDIQQSGNQGGTFSVTARRACSGDGTTPCLRDDTCSSLGLGTCSVGDGSIFFDGELQGNGWHGGTAIFRAAGDITIANTIRLSGSFNDDADGGFLEIESGMGSITTTGKLKANGGGGGYYYFPSGGEIEMTAALDVNILREIELGVGAALAGDLTVRAGRNLTVSDNILANAGQLQYASGGSIDLAATGDLLVSEPDRPGTTKLTVNGGSGFHSYYQQFIPGESGSIGLSAGNDLTFSQKGVLTGEGGSGSCYGDSRGGDISIYAKYGLVTLDGEIRARGRGLCGRYGHVDVEAGAGISVGKKGFVNVKAKQGGNIILETDGPIVIEGTLQAEGKLQNGQPNYYTYGGGAAPGVGGYVDIHGNTDVTIDGGKLLLGGDAGSVPGIFGGPGGLHIDACRLALANRASINHTHGAGLGYQINVGNYITVRESMTVDRKSKILADVSSNANNKITYRDPGKPPVLEGTIEPAPVLSVNPSLVGCPVCGNLEIDRGESCDDGNTTAGDSCSEVCQDEGCIADTPGYPAVDLCDDSDACTLDLCDPVAHQCQNPISCDEGVACTTDACVTGACVNTPVDALCDDSNDCTDDICSAATGCVYAGITGPSCDDGDPCTVTGTCDGGTCVVTDKSYTQRNKINSVLRSGVDNDLLKVRLEMPLTDFTTSPTVTGLLVELFDADDQSVYSATLAASDWEDLRDLGTKFRFRDTQGPGGPANGMSSVKIAQKSNKGVAKFTAKMRGHEIPGAAAQERMTLSLLFGTDPAIDECLTARRVPCSSSTTRTSCKE